MYERWKKMKILRHDDDYNREYYFAIEGLPPNWVIIADHLGMDRTEYHQLMIKYGAKKIVLNKGETWTTKAERDNFLNSPELEPYLISKANGEPTRIELGIERIHQEILEKSWGGILMEHHPDISGWELFNLYKKIHDSRITHSRYAVFTATDKRLLIQLNKI